MTAQLRTVVAAVAAAAIAACGGSSAPGAGHAATANDLPVWREYAQCVRDHGTPTFPDPQLDDQGSASFPGNAAKSLPEGVQQACSPILARLSVRVNSGHPEDVAPLRQFAQCMRDHGIADWPDPDADGRFVYPRSLVQAHAQHSAYWLQARAAWDGPCRRYDNGHIGDPQS